MMQIIKRVLKLLMRHITVCSSFFIRVFTIVSSVAGIIVVAVAAISATAIVVVTITIITIAALVVTAIVTIS